MCVAVHVLELTLRLGVHVTILYVSVSNNSFDSIYSIIQTSWIKGESNISVAIKGLIVPRCGRLLKCAGMVTVLLSARARNYVNGGHKLGNIADPV